jgi:hypothetical protein
MTIVGGKLLRGLMSIRKACVNFGGKQQRNIKGELTIF